VRGWAAASAVAFVALVLGIVPWSTFTDALDALASPITFLLVAVPLADLLDEVGFFASLATSFGGTRPGRDVADVVRRPDEAVPDTGFGDDLHGRITIGRELAASAAAARRRTRLRARRRRS
jgi:hypothetical protein